MARIETDGLTKAFRGRAVLREVSFAVGPGSTLALFGPSGCGKTTLLNILAGLVRPDEGHVRLREVVVNNGVGYATPPEQRRIAMVFQDLALWPHITASRHLNFVARNAIPQRESRKERIRDELAAVGLESLAGARPGRMSGGERQRLAIARALIQDRDILLLDEPFSHLDDPWRDRIVDRLTALKREGTAIVLATHRREDVRMLADDILLFNADGATLKAADSFS